MPDIVAEHALEELETALQIVHPKLRDVLTSVFNMVWFMFHSTSRQHGAKWPSLVMSDTHSSTLWTSWTLWFNFIRPIYFSLKTFNMFAHSPSIRAWVTQYNCENGVWCIRPGSRSTSTTACCRPIPSTVDDATTCTVNWFGKPSPVVTHSGSSHPFGFCRRIDRSSSSVEQTKSMAERELSQTWSMEKCAGA